MYLSRRAFVESSAMIVTLGASAVAWSGSALPMLSESDPTASALGYKAEASAVDTTKFHQYAAGESCSNCALYQGVAGDASGRCPIYPGKAVSAKGWCASYGKKA